MDFGLTLCSFDDLTLLGQWRQSHVQRFEVVPIEPEPKVSYSV